MQTDLNSIVEAIERVVVAPYTPSLHSLETRVESVSDNVLRQWTECKPCQVSLFAAVLLEQCHSAKKLLGRFGQIGCVRDALLHHDPTFLDQMLQGAIENANLQDLDVCLSLLSSPVSDNISVPARIPALLARLLGDVAQNPCAARIKPLYNIMQGLLSNEGLLQLMPENLMTTFQREGTMILKSLNDPLATLLSLATFARIRTLWKPKNDSGTQPQWLEKICLVFGPKSSNKTLDLVIIAAIMACSSSSTNLAPSERVLLVRLAIEICHEIDDELRKTWLKAHSQKLVKLCEKVKRTDIDPELRVLGLVLLFTFSKCLTLPTDIVQLMREQLRNPITYDVIIATPDSVTEMFFDQLLAHSEDDYATLCLATTERLNTKSTGYIDGIVNSRVDHMLVSALARSERGSMARRSFRERLSQSEFRLAALHQYAEEFSTRCASRRCETSQVCYAKVELQRDKTFLEILDCIYPTDDGTKNHGLQKLFIRSLKRPRVSSSGCVFASLKTLERKRYFREQAVKPVVPTTSTDFSSHEWRAKIATLLTENAKTSHETVIQQMEAMLADLENRCDTVEEPLRLAAKEREDLNRQLVDSNQRNQQLEEKFKQATEIIHGLNRKLDEAIAHSQDYSVKIAQLTGQLDALRAEHDDVRRDAQDGLEAGRLKARDRELDLMATVAERDELLEEQQAEIDAVIKVKTRLQEELDNSSKQHQVISRECDNLRSNMAQLQKDAAQDRDALQYEITKLQQVMEIRDSTNAEKDNRIRMLGEINRDINNENQTLKSKLEQAETKLEKSASSLEEARASYKSGFADIELEYKNRSASTDKKIQQLVENHESEISRLRHDAAIASTKLQKEVRAKDKRIQYLEKKVDAFRTERAAKSREFSEAQEHISRLMSVMGFNKETTSNSNKKQTSTESAKAGKAVRRSSRLSMLQAQPGTESQMEMTLMQSEYLPRRVSVENEVRRQPLGELDQNSPNKSPHSSNSKYAKQDRSIHVAQVESQGDMHVTQAGNVDVDVDVDVDLDLDLDLDFDDEDLLTSTIRA